jgi:glycosyltransferase involved in cell wall biosynthesis
MKNPIPRIKSYSPVVKKRSLYAQIKLVEEYGNRIIQLEHESEDKIQQILNLKTEAKRLGTALQRVKEYTKWMTINYPTTKTLVGQRLHSMDFGYRPLISIILPVYNTNPEYLKVCIESVLAQSYVNWQLCIVDDASTNQDTLDTLNKYTKSDPRIFTKRAKHNGHISVASNMAIEMATGEFVALLDHDDFLWPNALYEVINLLQDHRDADLIYSDEDKIEADGLTHFYPYFKPDWSPHLLECINYITHFSVLRTSLVRQLGGFDKHLVGAQDWDLFLRVTEHTNRVHHISTVLYSWRSHSGSTAMKLSAKDYALVNQRTTLDNHLRRVGKYSYEVKMGVHSGFWNPGYKPQYKPLISIIIPTKDKPEYLKRCIDTILKETSYDNYEIIIVDTGSREQDTKIYYNKLKKTTNTTRLSIKYWRHQPFNYSDACNFGAKHAKGEYLVMLNNDTEIMTKSWLEDMLGYAQQDDVAAVGVKLLYSDHSIQHAGVMVGIGNIEPVADHVGAGSNSIEDDQSHEVYVNTIRDTTAVTAACMMVSTNKFWQVKGFDILLRVTFNDVDLCLKFIKAGYRNVYLPHVELIHHESISIGRVFQNRDMKELEKAAKFMRKRWNGSLDTDPCYNRNFYKLSNNFGLDVYEDRKINSESIGL